MRSLFVVSVFAPVLGCFSPSGNGGEATSSATGTGDGTTMASADDGTTTTVSTSDDVTTGPGPSTVDTTVADETTDAADGPTSVTDSSSSATGSSSGGEACGNGTVEGVEECDGTEGCTAGCELEHFECHPLLQVDCPAGSQCIWDVFDSNFTCSAMGDVSYGGACASLRNLYCEPGLICVNDTSFPNCLSTGCCSNYCDTNNGNADCFAPLECVSFWQVGFGDAPGPGLETVGICVTT